jgi:hypothetical protein
MAKRALPYTETREKDAEGNNGTCYSSQLFFHTHANAFGPDKAYSFSG